LAVPAQADFLNAKGAPVSTGVPFSMHLRPAHIIAVFAALLMVAARADTPAAPETMAERHLKEIVEHQKVLFADAVIQGNALEEAGFKTQVEQLTHEYESLLKDNPDFAAGFASYGYMLWKVGLRKQAVAILLKANQMDPDIPLVKNELGNYLAEEGKPLEALNYYLAAVRLEPDEPLYHYQLGTLLYEARDDFLRSGEWSRTSLDHSMQDAFKRAAELAPDRLEFTYRFAESFYDLQEPDWPAALAAWQGLEAHAQSEIERQTMRLHEANVLLYMGKTDRVRKILDSVTDPTLGDQKQKLAARLVLDAGSPAPNGP
jgi:tetratricopeptide (TPR) repeat protein